MYTDIAQPERIKGLKYWKNPKNDFNVIALHYSSDPNKDPERDGKEWYEAERKGVLRATWIKEYEIDFTTKAGKLIYGPEFCDFDPNVHFIQSFEFEEPVEYLLALDFGQRHPTCALVGIWTLDNCLYIIDEYYKPAIPSVSSREMFTQFEYLLENLEDKSLREKRLISSDFFQIRIIDPTTRAKNRTKVIEGEELPYSVCEEFYDNGWEFEPGNNSLSAGITRIREYFQLDSNNKARLYIFKDKCPYLCKEIENYRYRELTETQEKTKSKSEEPIKKDDHSVDALRYMIMTRPTTPQIAEKPKTRIQRDIENLLRPKIIVNDWDNDGLLS